MSHTMTQLVCLVWKTAAEKPLVRLYKSARLLGSWLESINKNPQQQQQQQQSLLFQASWGRLEMKPIRHKGHDSGTLIASLQALLSKATSSEISQSLRSLLTDSSRYAIPN